MSVEGLRSFGVRMGGVRGDGKEKGQGGGEGNVLLPTHERTNERYWDDDMAYEI